MYFFLPDRDVGDCLFDNSGGHEKGWLGWYLLEAVQPTWSWCTLSEKRWTGLSSTESQPKKVVDVVVVVAVLVIVVVGIVVVGLLVIVVIIVGRRNLTLQFGQNWVNYKWYILYFVVVVVVATDVAVVGPET